MTVTRKDVKDACDLIAPEFDFDPDLIFAVCLIEGGKDSAGSFDPSVARLEQGYYRRYVEHNDYATTTEILLSASYGVMQLMGLSLLEAGFFEFYFNQVSDDFKKVIKEPRSMFAMTSALNAFCVHLDWMIRFGCKWMDKKRQLADGDVTKMLSFWNGDLTGHYASKVLKKYNSIKGNQ